MLALIIIGSIFTHFFIGGIVSVRTDKVWTKNCARHYCDADSCFHKIASYLSFVIWPIILPSSLGILIGRSDKEGRAERKRDAEVAKANHKVHLAELRRKEIDALEKHVGVGPYRTLSD